MSDDGVRPSRRIETAHSAEAPAMLPAMPMTRLSTSSTIGPRTPSPSHRASRRKVPM